MEPQMMLLDPTTSLSLQISEPLLLECQQILLPRHLSTHQMTAMRKERERELPFESQHIKFQRTLTLSHVPVARLILDQQTRDCHCKLKRMRAKEGQSPEGYTVVTRGERKETGDRQKKQFYYNVYFKCKSIIM